MKNFYNSWGRRKGCCYVCRYTEKRERKERERGCCCCCKRRFVSEHFTPRRHSWGPWRLHRLLLSARRALFRIFFLFLSPPPSFFPSFSSLSLSRSSIYTYIDIRQTKWIEIYPMALYGTRCAMFHRRHLIKARHSTAETEERRKKKIFFCARPSQHFRAAQVLPRRNIPARIFVWSQKNAVEFVLTESKFRLVVDPMRKFPGRRNSIESCDVAAVSAAKGRACVLSAMAPDCRPCWNGEKEKSEKRTICFSRFSWADHANPFRVPTLYKELGFSSSFSSSYFLFFFCRKKPPPPLPLSGR